MDPYVALILYAVAFVCASVAAFGSRYDRIKALAVAFAAFVLVHGGWDALQAAIHHK